MATTKNPEKLNIHVMPQEVHENFLENNKITDYELYLVESESDVVSIAEGGTSANNAKDARVNLGVETAEGTVYSGNADYAEVGEWGDGNPNKEDRIGYFVALDSGSEGITMRKATSIDDVKGVTVSAPAFSGNRADSKCDTTGKLLPAFDYVGILGVVTVIDNATCTVDGRCMPADDGTAIPSTNEYGYYVIQRFDENHIIIAIEPGADMIQRIGTEITDINNKIRDLDKIVPDYWLESLQEGAKFINTALTDAGDNKSSFLFYTDLHWNDSAKNVPELLKYIHKNTGMSKTVFGGDIVSTENTDYDTMSYLWDWRNAIKDLPNHHSVVGNHDDGNVTNNLFTKEYVYGYLLAPEETPDIVRSNDGFYYYIDVPTEKTRYLYLDTAYQGVNINQLNFVKKALKNIPANWHIIAIAHTWYDVNYTVTPPTVAGLNGHASILLDIFDRYNARLDEFDSCRGWVEFCIGGHSHTDYNATSNSGIPIILVETASLQIRSGLDGTVGTTNEASINGIIANYETKTLSIVRIGRGVSREIALVAHEEVIVGNPNLIPISTNNSGGITGLMSDKRYNSSGILTDSTVGHKATGYMPAVSNDILQFSGFDFNTGMSNASSSYIWFYDKNYAKINGFAADSENPGATYQIVRDANGNIMQLVVPEDGNIAYFTVCGDTLDAESEIMNLSIDVGGDEQSTDLDSYVFITTDDIDNICGRNIKLASEVTF